MQTSKSAVDPGHLAQGTAKVYIYYRCVLSLVLLGMYYSGAASNVFGTNNPLLYQWTAIGYALATSITATVN